MGYEYSFDAQPTINGSNISEIKINGNLPDEVYCNGSHIAHLKKDVSALIYHRYIYPTGNMKSEEYVDCDTTYHLYQAEMTAWLCIEVDHDSLIGTGKRIEKIDWWGFTDFFGATMDTQSGTILRPPIVWTYLIPLQTAYTKLYYIAPSVRSEYFPSGTTPYNVDEVKYHEACLYCRTRANCTITYTDGTTKTIGWKDRYLHDGYIPSTLWTTKGIITDFSDISGDENKSTVTYRC